jgi:hypothetical protein
MWFGNNYILMQNNYIDILILILETEMERNETFL